jgi:hypothetical protein
VSTTLALASSAFASADDVGFFFSKKRAAKIREEIKTSPVNTKLVQTNLQKISAGVQAARPEQITSLGLTVEDQQGLISSLFAINLAASSPFFQKLALRAYAKDDRSAYFYNVDTVGIKGSVTVDSYSTLKAIQLQSLQDQNLTVAEALKKLKNKCGGAAVSLKNKDAFEQLECIIELSLLSTSNFSEWLVSIDAPVKALTAAAKATLRERVGRWDSLTFLTAYTCNKMSWFCRGEYLYASISSWGAGTSSLGLEITITQNELKFDLNVTARRQIVDAIQGVLIGSVSGLDLIRYVALKEIEKMDQDDIERSTKLVVELIDGAVQLAQKKNKQVELKNP